MNWTGSAMGLTDLQSLTARSRILLIGLAGMENAGKTTFLALLYSLLRRGQSINHYRFAGSYTLSGWELITSFLTFENGSNQVTFPPHTSRNAGRIPGLLHLALKTEADYLLDVVFTDAPGEWFNEWRSYQQADNAVGAEWIHHHGDGFLLFADCEELAGINRGITRTNIQMIADRLVVNLGSRPLGLVWSKSDVENNRPAMREKIQSHIQTKAPQHYQEFSVSVMQNDPQWHQQVLQAVGWLLDTIEHAADQQVPTIPLADTDDLFLLRRSVLV
ncbi:hypothetical protein EXU85_30105 [Spirosoma sp. KCTC 42546]|uniref:TRAFAC clade GTPase domain-containing protein n=1 Tax=Spirosoma sp. KCTC 42546 TaxID=2520506 RepID=UPI00115AEB2B|nr:hypothetical protein [Spirosoma sp. KCTC 42546]QDK82633.1 hypothetical protein EXU85_30105 [Spirosoma sp. KCTC 42546]